MTDMAIDLAVEAGSQWVLGDVQINPKGTKRCPLTTANGEDVFFKSAGELLVAPFGPSSFDKDPEARRQGLDMRTAERPGELEKCFQELDEWAIQYLSEHSERILKKPLTKDQVAAGYTSSLKQKQGYNPLVRTKIDISGRRSICYWTIENEAREAPADWKSTLFRVNIHISSLWIMGSSYGLIVNVTDMEIVKENVEPDATMRANPFA